MDVFADCRGDRGSVGALGTEFVLNVGLWGERGGEWFEPGDGGAKGSDSKMESPVLFEIADDPDTLQLQSTQIHI